MSIKTFDKLLEAARAKGPKRIAVAAAHQSEVMLAGLDAEVAGLAEVILVGDKGMIERIAAEEGFDIAHGGDPPATAARSRLAGDETGQRRQGRDCHEG